MTDRLFGGDNTKKKQIKNQKNRQIGKIYGSTSERDETVIRKERE